MTQGKNADEDAPVRMLKVVLHIDGVHTSIGELFWGTTRFLAAVNIIYKDFTLHSLVFDRELAIILSFIVIEQKNLHRRLASKSRR